MTNEQPRVDERSGVRVVLFEFSPKRVEDIEFERAAAAIKDGHFVWIDIDTAQCADARELITNLNLVGEDTIEDMFSGEEITQLSRFESHLHVAVIGCRVERHDPFALERSDIVIGARYLLSIRHGPRSFIDTVRRDYRADFEQFAESPSFLVYELWHALTEHYVSIQKGLERRVEGVQKSILADSSEERYAIVSELGSDLLHFRSVLMPARTVINELSTRRTMFISAGTQPFLANMAGTIEGVLQDVLVDRDILAQSLNLQMSIVADRTNRAMSKLTVISTIFLPLSFLCGLYGMNFRNMPELGWRYGYAMFWVVCSGIILTLVMVMKRAKLL